jgi:hypothetical protein
VEYVAMPRLFLSVREKGSFIISPILNHYTEYLLKKLQK